MKRAFIIHGWGGYAREGWQAWLANQLEAKQWSVATPSMPNTDWPRIEEWVPFLGDLVGTPDKDTHFVGHSIGCQTIFRYLATLSADTKVGHVMLIAPWMNLTDAAIHETEDSPSIAHPWVETPIDWTKIRPMAKSWTALMSSDDPWVPISDAKIFTKELGAAIIRTDGRKHMSASDDVTELPEALDSLLKPT